MKLLLFNLPECKLLLMHPLVIFYLFEWLKVQHCSQRVRWASSPFHVAYMLSDRSWWVLLCGFYRSSPVENGMSFPRPECKLWRKGSYLWDFRLIKPVFSFRIIHFIIVMISPRKRKFIHRVFEFYFELLQSC